MNKPLLILPIADLHVGSIYGLHPNYIERDGSYLSVDEAGGWFYKNRPENYYLNAKQVRMWRHYEKGIRALAKLRKEKDCDLLIVYMGDVIDGDHHATHQLVTHNESEQMLAFTKLAIWTNEVMGFVPGQDKLVVLEGTEAHTRDNEEVIGQWLAAEKFSDGASCIPFLEIDVHGNLFWFYHHGVAAGYSYTKGSGLYNYLRKIYIDRRMNEKRPPNFIITADKHSYDYQMYKHNDHMLQGIICPPFQDKTRFTNKLPGVIASPTKVGFAPLLAENGKVYPLDPYLLEMPLNEVLVW